jgi:hypothetical protein
MILVKAHEPLSLINIKIVLFSKDNRHAAAFTSLNQVKEEYFLTINVPVVYMGRDICFWMWK